MRTTKFFLILLSATIMPNVSFAQMNKHDKSIATYNYTIAISEVDSDNSGPPLNAEIDQGMVGENATPAMAPAMPAPMTTPMNGEQGQAPMMPYQDDQSPGMPSTQAMQIGATAPEFNLPQLSGGMVSLKDILAKGPAVILFTNGSSCGFCVTQMQLLQKNQQQFAALGIQTIAISSAPMNGLMQAKQRLNISYPLLNDVNSAIARQYGVMSSALVTVDASGEVVDVQTEQRGMNVFNLTQATNPLRPQQDMAAPVDVPTSPATAVPSTQVAPPSMQPNAIPPAMPPVPSPQAGKVKFDVPPSNPNFGKIDEKKSIAI